MPLKFSPDPSQRPDIKLPALWGAGNKKCTIALQFDPDRGGYDRLSLLGVQAAGLAVAVHCVMRPPHMGGTVEVGWGKHMVVNVLALADTDSPDDGDNGTLSSERFAQREQSRSTYTTPASHIDSSDIMVEKMRLTPIRITDGQAATMLKATSMFLFSLVSFLVTNLTAASPSNLTTPGLRASYECWHSPGVSLVYRDCVQLIRYQLGFPHDPTVPMTFSRKKEAMILIPYAKNSPRGNCNIVLGIRGDSLGTEVEKWENIKQAALEIAISCVIKEPHRGGYAWMGEHNNLLVSMVGRDTGTALLRKDDVVVKDDMTFYAI
ncbi:MAG: hypothetical protein Q9185_005854 [Variospora sp. 1 TL-2023]